MADAMRDQDFEAYLEAVRWIVWSGIGQRRAGTSPGEFEEVFYASLAEEQIKA